MAFVSSIDVIGSGFTAQQQRLDIISENIVNMNTTRTENGEGPYRRKVVVFEADNGGSRFQDVLARTRNGSGGRFASDTVGGVRVAEVAEDPSDFKLKYDPGDPDANEDGYVEMPNVDLVKEITDGMAASQAFTADITAFNLLKTLLSKGLEIGK
ncbi:MAG: flagellar basal body rod protein FlgC [Lawsonibacter sp.]|jgi:flagellar basal-body rod protein FlgC|uniref:flagellar basal body rod protein FlgC n=1 Tax=Lawsonibacter sp. JLR.KK007 TaxID=3114293 RepID=UPI0021722B63|nr:flagellar basal body rod protein FlgC [Lawsonibacter sp.]MCI8989256.1 flagellar basal body rod protein FlgC [Lawsonibacter sp.]MCI9267791.1 flagellar basal body rod protein FlgC [Lawsonibacter sp.]